MNPTLFSNDIHLTFDASSFYTNQHASKSHITRKTLLNINIVAAAATVAVVMSCTTNSIHTVYVKYKLLVCIPDGL